MKQDSTNVRTSKNSEFEDWITEVHHSFSTQNEKSAASSTENQDLSPVKTQLIEYINHTNAPTLENIKCLNSSIASINHQDPHIRYRFILLALSVNKICLFHGHSGTKQTSQLVENVRKIRFLVQIHHNIRSELASKQPNKSKDIEEILSLLQIYDQYITDAVSHTDFLFVVIKLVSSHNQLNKTLRKTLTTSAQLKSLIIQLIKWADTIFVSTYDIKKQEPLLILIFNLLQTTVQKYPNEAWAWIPYNRFKIICNIQSADWVSSIRTNEDFTVILWFLIGYDRLNMLQGFLKNYPQQPQKTAFGMHTLWVLQLLLDEENLAVKTYKKAVKEFPNYFKEKGNDRINRHMLLELACIKLGHTKFADRLKNHYTQYLTNHLDHSALKKKLLCAQTTIDEIDVQILFPSHT